MFVVYLNWLCPVILFPPKICNANRRMLCRKVAMETKDGRRFHGANIHLSFGAVAILNYHLHNK